MKLALRDLRVLTPDEVAEHDEYVRQASLDEAWRQWAMASCIERGGHWWHLTIDPDDGVSLECLGGCGIGINDLADDGYDLMTGEFEVMPGYVLSLDIGEVRVNGRLIEPWDYGPCIAYGWKGPVTVSVRVEKYGGYFEPAEYDVWIDLEPAVLPAWMLSRSTAG